MAQLYEGKRAISKGIVGAIRKFVMFAFSAPLVGTSAGSICATRWTTGAIVRNKPVTVRSCRIACTRLP